MAYKIGAVQFSDGELYRPQVITTTRVDGMTAQEIAFTQLNNTALADTIDQTKAIFTGKVIATPPPGFAAITLNDFEVYLNGRRVPSSQVTSILQIATPVKIEVDINVATFLDIPNAVLEENDEVVLVGKFN
jgi:hypothetical protein